MLFILFELYYMYTSEASRKDTLHRISVMIPDAIINVISLLIQYITDHRKVPSKILISFPVQKVFYATYHLNYKKSQKR